jgi:L-ascorbate metabolism protein UlaG (beta-lactamase superfamily)
MKITWLGHASFLLETEGIKILTDPYDDSVGYKPILFEVDIVTVSHEHGDHNNVESLRGNPEVVRGSGIFNVRGIKIRGVATYHDDEKGSKRGENTVYVIEAEKLVVCHAGDLGHTLSPDQVDAIGNVDVLLLPVGGTYTTDAVQADEVMQALNPRLVIPMHFKTASLDFPIDGVETFVSGRANAWHSRLAYIEVSNASLPKEREIAVLDHLL